MITISNMCSRKKIVVSAAVTFTYQALKNGFILLHDSKV